MTTSCRVSHDPIAAALAEDIGPGDATVEFFVDPDAVDRRPPRIFAKEPAVVAGGVQVAAEVFARIDPISGVSSRSTCPDGVVVANWGRLF